MKTYPKLEVLIITLDQAVLSHHLPVLCLPDQPELDDVRKLLQHGPLGKPDRDIFFPTWTMSLHVYKRIDAATVPSLDDLLANRITIDSAGKLRDVLGAEEAAPGTVCIVLQQCRSKRYSRRKDVPPHSPVPNIAPPISISPVSSRSATPPHSPRQPHKKDPVAASRWMHPPGPSPASHSVYHTVPYEAIYYEQQIVPISIVAPPSIYPQCYTIPVGVHTQPLPGYGYVSGSPFVPQVFPGYYGYAGI